MGGPQLRQDAVTFSRRGRVLVLGMLKKVIRCGVCTRVHDVAELLNLKQFVNGTFTFDCPVKKTGGTYQLEQVGTLNVKPVVA
jgi:hypothetical protein